MSALAALSQEPHKGWGHRQCTGSSHGPPHGQRGEAIAKIQEAKVAAYSEGEGNVAVSKTSFFLWYKEGAFDPQKWGRMRNNTGENTKISK